jgi:hypothetical protein
MFRECDSVLFLSLCTACIAVYAVSAEPFSMKRDKVSVLCVLCVETSIVSP